MLPLAVQLVKATKEQIYETGLELAEGLGLNVTSWAAGDPTRSTYKFLSSILSSVEEIAYNLVLSAFLDYAEGEWLTLVAKQGFDVDRVVATYAATTVRFTNTGGGLYDGLEAGDITVQNTATGKTYHTTSGGTLAIGPGTTLDLDVIADEAGSDSSAAATEIDDIVSGLPGGGVVTVSNATAAIGIDEESDADLRARCRLKLSALSDKGPKGIYDYIARTPSLSGAEALTRSRTIGDSDTGDVTLYVAGPSGAVSAGDITAVTDAINRLAAPINDTPTVVNCSNVTIAVTYELWIYASVGKTEDEVKDAIEADLAAMFAARPIGGDILTPGGTGKLYKSLIVATITESFPDQIVRVDVAAPAGDTTLTISQVAALGTVTGTINFVTDP